MARAETTRLSHAPPARASGTRVAAATTVAPAAANRRVIAAPNPLLAPVTNTVGLIGPAPAASRVPR